MAKNAPLLLLLCLSLSCATAPRTSTVPSEPLHIVVAQTTDLHGWIDGHPETTNGSPRLSYRSGGLDVLARYLANLRSANAAVVVVDSGDLFQGTLASNLFEGEPVIRLYNQLRYDAVAVGNHEFDFGPVGPKSQPIDAGDDPLGALKRNIAAAHFPFLSANIRIKGSGVRPSWVKPYLIVTRGGARIGLIGATTEDTPSTTLPINVASLDFTDAAREISAVAAELHQQKVDAVVVIAHIGGECRDSAKPGEPADCKTDTFVARLAEALPAGSVDVIFGGHSHFPVRQTVHGIAIAQAAALGRGLAVADLWVDRSAHHALPERTVIRPLVSTCEQVFEGTSECNPKNANGALVAATFEGRRVVADPAAAAIMKGYLEQVETKKGESLGIAVAAPFTRDYNAESTLGNLIADALRADGGTDFAMVNSGGLRADLKGPQVTFGEMFEIMPFDNFVTRLTLTGAEIQRIFELTFQGDHGALQVSGLHVLVDMSSKPASVAVTKSDGTPLDPAGRYTLTTIDFLASGGGGLGPVMQNVGPERKEIFRQKLIRDAAIVQLRKMSAAQPLAPRLEKRIEIRNAASR